MLYVETTKDGSASCENCFTTASKRTPLIAIEDSWSHNILYLCGDCLKLAQSRLEKRQMVSNNTNLVR